MLTHTHQSENQAVKTATPLEKFFKGGGSAVPFFQAKLTVNTPDDSHEREADAVADKVMRMPTPATISPCNPLDENKNKTQLKPIPFSQISRKCAHCEEEEKVQRKESTSGGGQTAPSIVNDVISSSGKPLDGGTRHFMESRMGHDFSHVQVHTDGKAAESATAVNALAYTSGNHIVFNNGQYAPDTEGGKRLLAHELVHVGQQEIVDTIRLKSGEPNELLKGLHEQVGKDPIKRIEQAKLNNRENEKEANFPKKDKKQLEHKIRERINIKERITKKIKEIEHLKMKVKKTQKRGKKIDKINSKFLSGWIDKKEVRQIGRVDKSDFELLEIKVHFNLLNDQIKEAKGYIDGGIANYKEDGLTIPNIEDNYVFSSEEIATITDKGFSIPDNAKKYILTGKSTKDDEKKEFDTKDAALTLVKLYLDEGEFKYPTLKSLSVDDKLVILKYYQVEDGKEYDLYLLRKFIVKYLSPQDVQYIFGNEEKQINPDIYIKMLEPGVTSMITKEPKDQRMKDLHNQIYKESSWKFRRAGKLSDTVKNETSLYEDVGLLLPKEILDSIKSNSKYNHHVKKLEKLKDKGYTGEYIADETKKSYKELLKSSSDFRETLKEINHDNSGNKGQSDNITNLNGKKITDLQSNQITPENKKNQDELFFTKMKYKDTPPTTEEEIEENNKANDLAYVSAMFKDIKYPILNDIKEILIKDFGINEDITNSLQNKWLPYWKNNKEWLKPSAWAAGGLIVIPLGIKFIPDIYNDEYDKINKKDFGSIGATVKYIPNWNKKFSLGKEYHYGGKEYAKTNAEAKVKFYQENRFLNNALTEKMIQSGSGMNASKLREQYISYLSPKIEFIIEDSVKKSGNPWFKQNWSVYLDNRFYLSSKANLGPIQSLDQTIQNIKSFKHLDKIFTPELPTGVEDTSKSIYDYQLGSKNTFNLGNQKLTASGDYLSLNNFDPDVEVMRRLAFNLEYEYKLFIGGLDSLTITGKFGAARQDIDNNYNLLKDTQNFNLGLAYNFDNHKEGKKGSGSIYISGDYDSSTDPKVSIKTGATYKLDPKHLFNNVFQSELKIEYRIDSKGLKSLEGFIMIRARNQRHIRPDKEHTKNIKAIF